METDPAVVQAEDVVDAAVAAFMAVLAGGELAVWLSLRDGKCPFPGCSNNSLDNEADHILAWHKGGTTGINNLGQPCRKHHKLRHTSGWKPTPATMNEPPRWISPSGRHYKSEHQDWEPPHWSDQLQPVPPRLAMKCSRS